MCTDTLVRNLRLWSIITNESSFGKIGYEEVGMKRKVFLNFYKFSVTVKRGYGKKGKSAIHLPRQYLP